jgi:hypothetical protein
LFGAVDVTADVDRALGLRRRRSLGDVEDDVGLRQVDLRPDLLRRADRLGLVGSRVGDRHLLLLRLGDLLLLLRRRRLLEPHLLHHVDLLLVDLLLLAEVSSGRWMARRIRWMTTAKPIAHRIVRRSSSYSNAKVSREDPEIPSDAASAGRLVLSSLAMVPPFSIGLRQYQKASISRCVGIEMFLTVHSLRLPRAARRRRRPCGRRGRGVGLDDHRLHRVAREHRLEVVEDLVELHRLLIDHEVARRTGSR